MAKQKKTMKVQLALDRANHLLSLPESDHVSTEFKSGVCSLIEAIIFENGSYNGYMHLDKDNCEFGTFGYFSRKYF